MNRYVTVGLAVLAGAALFEAALIPGIVVGGAIVLAPRYLPKLRRRLQPAIDEIVRPPAPRAGSPGIEPLLTVPAEFGVKQALAKTITFRVINTALDFTTNYVVIGELAAAAGLSIFALAVGPLFYFAHEAAWNYFGPSGTAVDFRALLSRRRDEKAGAGELAVTRPLAKTITFRSFATAMDFTSNYVVIGDLAAAAGLSAIGFVIGPFVYLGHEMVWDHYSARGKGTTELPSPNLVLPKPVPGNQAGGTEVDAGGNNEGQRDR
jgi:uncharacterized membrane protein